MSRNSTARRSAGEVRTQRPHGRRAFGARVDGDDHENRRPRQRRGNRLRNGRRLTPGGHRYALHASRCTTVGLILRSRRSRRLEGWRPAAARVAILRDGTSCLLRMRSEIKGFTSLQGGIVRIRRSQDLTINLTSRPNDVMRCRSVCFTTRRQPTSQTHASALAGVAILRTSRRKFYAVPARPNTRSARCSNAEANRRKAASNIAPIRRPSVRLRNS